MNAETATQLVIVLLAACVVASIGGWARFGRNGLAADRGGPARRGGRRRGRLRRARHGRPAVTTLVVVLAGRSRSLGGGPVTTRVFAAVDAAGPVDRAGTRLDRGRRRGAPRRRVDRRARAGRRLREPGRGDAGGRRDRPGLKGLGRYPELRNPEDSPGAAERFIIGTFTSVLWAAACAGVLALPCD